MNSVTGLSLLLDWTNGLATVVGEANGKEVFPGDLPISVKKLGMDGDLAEAIANRGGRRWAWTTHSAETSTHHPEGLPEQEEEAEPVEQGKELGKKGRHRAVRGGGWRGAVERLPIIALLRNLLWPASKPRGWCKRPRRPGKPGADGWCPCNERKVHKS